MWDIQRWDQHHRTIRSALHKRDTIARTLQRQRDPDPAEGRRQYRAWAAKARAHLHRLAVLAEQAPEPGIARQTVAQLNHWMTTGPA